MQQLTHNFSSANRHDHNVEEVTRSLGREVEYQDLRSSCVDELVESGVQYILKHGVPISSRAGAARQAYGVSYTLTDPTNRLHTSRPGAIKYLAREFLAYFKGSLVASDGLEQASSFWKTLADEDGRINSNYGYYVFHQVVVDAPCQYDWVRDRLIENNDTRRAFININQPSHKSDTKDFPCTIGMQFFIRDRHLFCEVASRSTDVVTGLPYDISFFSFVHELLWRDLIERGYSDLRLGSTTMKTSFTQIYDTTYTKALSIGERRDEDIKMPAIESASDVLDDIRSGTEATEVLKWITKHAQ
jgi:thymidylate synthase